MKALLTSAIVLGTLTIFEAIEPAQAATSYQGQTYQGQVIPAGYYRRHRGYYYSAPVVVDPYYGPYYGRPYYYYNDPAIRIGPISIF